MNKKYLKALTQEEFEKKVAKQKRLPQETIDRLRRVLVDGEPPRAVAKDTGITATRMYDVVSSFMNGRRRRTKRWPEITDASTPCQVCQHFNKCRYELKACEIFAEFVAIGIVYSPEKAKPTEGYFSKLFPTHPITIARKDRKRVLRERRKAKTGGKVGRPRKNAKPEDLKRAA